MDRLEQMRNLKERHEKEEQNLRQEYRRRFETLFEYDGCVATEDIMQLNDWYDEAKTAMEIRQITEIVEMKFAKG